MSEELDHLYLKRVLSGEKDAFRYFIRSYQEMALKIAFSLVQDETQARHIVQNAFIQAFKSLPNFKQEAKFSSWLYRIVVNESIKINRKSKLEQRTVQITPNHMIALTTNNGALDTIELKEKKEEINRILSLMKPKERLMLELFYLQENSIMEIKVITGFSTSNIKVLLHRARKNFATFFKASN
ncbi:MAG: sigma-70 family RNA polymerase sigma factor [Cyanothece sp. SIO1E1]|nr:sigma-70 family RNA polymerase sigma factor [Cyanothece sp. SIO1E1]